MTEPEKRDCGCELKTLPRTVLPFMSPDNCRYPALLAAFKAVEIERDLQEERIRTIWRERNELILDRDALKILGRQQQAERDALLKRVAVDRMTVDGLKEQLLKECALVESLLKRWPG